MPDLSSPQQNVLPSPAQSREKKSASASSSGILSLTRPQPGIRASLPLSWFTLAAFPGWFRCLRLARPGVFPENSLWNAMCAGHQWRTSQKQGVRAAVQWHHVHIRRYSQDPCFPQQPPSLWFCAGYPRILLAPAAHLDYLGCGFMCENTVLT